jgi:putative DNA primase/helicase
MKFLDEVTGGDEGVKRYLQLHFGYGLTGLTTEHSVLFIYGPGGNGKSVLQDAIVELMGDYAKTAAMETFSASRYQNHPTEIAALCGARLVASSETGEGQRLNMARVNQLTGGDRVTARFMRQDSFTFRPQFKAVFIGNHKPELGTVNDAARRRIVIVPFLYKPPEPDKNLPEKLKDEYPAILRWMIEGCLDWQKHGLFLPDVIKQATDDYFDDEDVLGQWISEKCQLGSGLVTGATALYQSWKEFAEANGEHPGSAKSFADKLKQQGFKSKKSGGTKYLGIGLNPTSTLNSKNDQ